MNVTALALSIAVALGAGDDSLTVLPQREGAEPPGKMLYSHLQKQAHAALDRRREEYEQVESREEIADYQEQRREFFVEQLGGFPDRTPLNPQVVGKLDGDGYRIEKVIFESQPNHHVTALLYLPEGEPPFPGVVVSSGHSRTAKTADYNQRFSIIMARHGMAALAYDPIGQGERSQILDAEGQPKYNSTTQEHFQIGVGSILVGTNTARYRIYDGMRAIDYLESRPEIDSSRIGFTGCSGGGTLTSYVMALDDRVTCAAPSCYLTTFRQLIDTIGPQDAEQNIHAQLQFGMDHPDYVLMRAPKPTLISATTGDYFDIEGTWDSFRQAKRWYTRLGHPERVDLVEGAGGHGVPMTNLNAIMRWMRRWLLDRDDARSEEEIPVRSEAELLCTEQGQVLALPDERSVFDLNSEIDSRLADERRSFSDTSSSADARAKVREIAGIRRLADLPEPESQKVGSIERDGYRIDKRTLELAPTLQLPVLAFVPPESSSDVYLYLHGEGKGAIAEEGGPLEELVQDGHEVWAVDLRGIGELRSEGSGGALGIWKDFFLAYLLGKSMVGMRAEDVLVSARILADEEDGSRERKVHLVAVAEAAVPALHAAAVEPNLFASVRLREMIPSWVDVVQVSETHNQLVNAVHGALRTYDLPDLIELCGSDRVTTEDPISVSAQ